MNTRTSLSIAVSLLLAASAHADFLTGRVVDSGGSGVGGVDIDVKNLGSGGDPTIFNDGTDPDGFFNVTIPDGQYLVTFTPPPPPTTTHLVLEIDDVVILGTKNLGTVTLSPGYSVSGHVEDTGNFPVAGVNIDVIDLSTGDNLTLANDFTDVLGNYSVAVPQGPIELRLDATSVFGPTLASHAETVTPTGNTVLPDQVLLPGFVLSGVVTNGGGFPLEEVDVDAHDATTGLKLYTPGDDTNAAGAFSFAVPAGTYDLSVCPDIALSLVAQGIDGLTVTSNVNLGTFALASGFLLLGNVTAWNGATVVGGDVDVAFVGGGSVTTCGDNTDSAGNYAVIVPGGNLRITFSPASWSQSLARDVRTVAVGGTQVLNGVLPACNDPVNFGAGLAGTGGIAPHIAGAGGAPSVGNPGLALDLQDGVGGGIAVLITGLQPLGIPLFGGTLHVNIDPNTATLYSFFLDGAAGVAGAGSASFAFPDLSALVGLTAYCQFLVRDFGAPAGWAMSEGLQFTICP